MEGLKTQKKLLKDEGKQEDGLRQVDLGFALKAIL